MGLALGSATLDTVTWSISSLRRSGFVEPVPSVVSDTCFPLTRAEPNMV